MTAEGLWEAMEHPSQGTGWSLPTGSHSSWAHLGVLLSRYWGKAERI